MIWRNLFPFFLLLSIVDGFISNAMFPAWLPLLYKDIFLILIFFLFILSEDWKTIVPLTEELGNPVMLSAGGFALWAFLQIFNPASPGLLLGMLGLKIYFLYWLLAPLSFLYITSREKVYSLIKFIVLASIPVNIFGLYQFLEGPQFLISTFGYGFSRAFFEASLEGSGMNVQSFYRIIGTFASTGQYSAFLTFNTIFCIAMIFSERFRKSRALWIFAGILSFIALLASGSRGYFLNTLLSISLLAFFSKRKGSIIAITLFAGISLWIGFSFLGTGVTARYKTLGSLEMVHHRTVETTGKMFAQSLDRYPLGKGIGSVSSAARHLKFQGIREEATFVENYPTKLQVEMGIPGVCLFFLFIACLLRKWLTEWLPREDTEFSYFATAISAVTLSYIFMDVFFGVIDTPPGYIFLWVIIGIMAKISVINKSTGQSTLWR